jgi:hypothetical protein
MHKSICNIEEEHDQNHVIDPKNEHNLVNKKDLLKQTDGRGISLQQINS